MIGAIIITHGRLAESLLKTAEAITGHIGNLRVMSVENSDTTERVRESLAGAVREVNAGKGVIIFTDMFGGTPTNVALSLLEAGKVEIITGVNLPIIIKFVSHRSEKKLSELAVLLKDYGQRSVVLAGDMLREKK